MRSVWLVESCGDDIYDRPVAVKTFKSVVAARRFCLERIEAELTEPEFGDVRPRESVFISVRRKFEYWHLDDAVIDREFFAYVPHQGSYVDSSGDPAEVEKLAVTDRWTVRKLEFVA